MCFQNWNGLIDIQLDIGIVLELASGIFKRTQSFLVIGHFVSQQGVLKAPPSSLSSFYLLVDFRGPTSDKLLNQANAMNYEEIQTSKTAKDKAGDNQSLTTYAETLKGDHEANQEAVNTR